ncbi:MAG: TatD family hydrolase [Cyanobacteria bacterium HKST-UBA01]|nr:TatD family hydrolase [Cyanobacteria bacterium HKST-UBA01]
MNLTLPSSKVGVIDSHAHVMREYFKESREEVIERAFDSNVRVLINPAVTVSDFDELKDLAESYDNIFFALGQHPHDAKDWKDEYSSQILEAGKHQKMVAVGECGLDFYYENSEKDVQMKVFREQIKLAKALRKPVIVHCRDAWQEAFSILKEEKDENLTGVFHCFTGGPEMIPTIEELDFYVSYSGIVTFKNAVEIQASVSSVRKDRILAETDCPFLAPQAVRGKQNEPSYVWWTVAKLAELLDCDLDTMAGACLDNTRRLFKLPE